MVRNAYKALRNQVLKVRGTESWTRSLPTNIQDSGAGRRTLYCSSDCPWLTHCRPQTDTEGTVHDPLMSHPALASPWCRQQETHFHKGAEISSSINNTSNLVSGWIFYSTVPVQRVWQWPITTTSH